MSKLQENTQELQEVLEILQEKADGYNKGFADGKQAQYDEFWDSSAAETSWTYRFAGVCWNSTTFRPPYNLNLRGNCYGCFNGNRIAVDLVQRLDELGITMSTSGATNVSAMFGYSLFTRLGEIDLTNVTVTVTETFRNMPSLKTIDKLIVTANTKFSGAFTSDTALENITIEGTIGQNGLDLQWSTKLSIASLTSIMTHLSTTTEGLSITLSKTAVDTAFKNGNIPGSESADWKDLVLSRSKWTINLV